MADAEPEAIAPGKGILNGLRHPDKKFWIMLGVGILALIVGVLAYRRMLSGGGSDNSNASLNASNLPDTGLGFNPPGGTQSTQPPGGTQPNVSDLLNQFANALTNSGLAAQADQGPNIPYYPVAPDGGSNYQPQPQPDGSGTSAGGYTPPLPAQPTYGAPNFIDNLFSDFSKGMQELGSASGTANRAGGILGGIIGSNVRGNTGDAANAIGNFFGGLFTKTPAPSKPPAPTPVHFASSQYLREGPSQVPIPGTSSGPVPVSAVPTPAPSLPTLPVPDANVQQFIP